LADGKGFHEKDNCAPHMLHKKRLNNGKLANGQPHPPEQPQLRCPECGSSKIWKAGVRRTNHGLVQRLLCRRCGYRFSESLNRDLNPGLQKPLQKSSDWSLNRAGNIHSNRQVCVALTEGAKNLAEVEARQEKPMREGTKPDLETVKGEILEYLFHLQKQGYRESTIKQKNQLLYRLLSLGADLHMPDTVKAVIARLDRSESYKFLLCIAYEGFAKHIGLAWTRPKYKQTEKLPFIPHETEIDSLIAGTDRKTATMLRLLKETAMRLGEAWMLEWTDLDVENRTLRCNNPEKNSRPRLFTLSPDLTQMLNQLPKVNQFIFGCGRGIQQGKTDPAKHRRLIQRQKSRITRQRHRVAAKLQNPRIEKITYHTLRHWKATMLYHQTKDILYVMRFLGHRSIKNTLIYIDLETACCPNGGDDYHTKVAKTEAEICSLIEAGFEYILQKDGLAYFRKRK
jgi:integrase/transcription elongation factor Elf1